MHKVIITIKYGKWWLAIVCCWEAGQRILIVGSSCVLTTKSVRMWEFWAGGLKITRRGMSSGRGFASCGRRGGGRAGSERSRGKNF